MFSKLSLSEQLDQEIYDEGILVRRDYLFDKNIGGTYYRSNMVSFPIITINTMIKTTVEENVIKAHELGHHYTGTCDAISSQKEVQRREEYRAHRWEVQRLLPPERLIELFNRGCTSPMEILDIVDIPYEEFYFAMDLWESVHGPQLEKGQYTITWHPFDIHRDRRKKA